MIAGSIVVRGSVAESQIALESDKGSYLVVVAVVVKDAMVKY